MRTVTPGAVVPCDRTADALVGAVLDAIPAPPAPGSRESDHAAVADIAG